MRRILLLLLIFPLLATAQTADAELTQLYARFRQMAKFDYNYPKENVYVHMDNTAYFTGETIWLKAYVVHGASLAPTVLSKVLYAELLNADGDLMERKLLRIENGEADGHFDLELPVTEGFYELRVFTREMLNWGIEACWSRVFPVFDKDAATESANPDDLRPVAEADLKPQHRRPFSFPRAGGVQLDFYPEGGNLVAGLQQRVAFKLTDRRGNALQTGCTLHAANGDTIAAFTPLHEGMGTFLLPEVTDGCYAKVEGFDKEKFPLPAVQANGYAMTARQSTEGIDLMVQRAADTPAAMLGLTVTCRNKLGYFDTLRVEEGAVELFIPYESLAEGVNHIALFGTDGKSLCSRLVFKRSAPSSVSLSILQNESSYTAFAPIALELHGSELTNGAPLEGRISISVRDAKTDLTADASASMEAELLLASEVKGYIANPDYYFNATTPLAALELLLMVQGWTANSIEAMTGAEQFQTPHPIEEKLTLIGRVLKDSDKERPRAGAELSLSMFSPKYGASLSSHAVTDSLGGFIFTSDADFMGQWLGQFTTKVNDKRKRSRVALDRFIDLPVRAFEFKELQPEPPVMTTSSEAKSQPQTFTWEDTIPRGISITLGEAVVTGKNKYRGLRGNRYSYKGGEKAGMEKATYYYNVEAEAERIKDAGGSTPTILDWIRETDDRFDYEVYVPQPSMNSTAAPADDEFGNFTYNNRPCMIFIDNDDIAPTTMFLEEIRSVVIIDRLEKWRKFMPTDRMGEESKYEAAIFIYTNPDFKYFLTKRGVDKRRIQGFAEPKKYYAPNYRYVDAPNPADFRRTLYWNPSLTLDESGKGTAVFFNNAVDGVELKISVRGRTKDGRFISVER